MQLVKGRPPVARPLELLDRGTVRLERELLLLQHGSRCAVRIGPTLLLLLRARRSVIVRDAVRCDWWYAAVPHGRAAACERARVHERGSSDSECH